ncbi:MAG: hypothetical protein L3J23_05285 [Flavobacteriaceae bacterium]|nr:hypothetical protein [Flavobacteriaceae bacterium]
MKKRIFLVVFLISLSVHSQHEVKFDVFDLIAFKALELTYQYNLNEEASVGVSIFNNLSNKNNIFNHREDFTITPYYRQYFLLGGVSNMYIEGFFAINSGKDFISVEITNDLGLSIDSVSKEVEYTDGAFGLAFGKSFISPRGFVLDLYAGIGRNLFDSNGSPSIVPRLGINTGFRF